MYVFHFEINTIKDFETILKIMWLNLKIKQKEKKQQKMIIIRMRVLYTILYKYSNIKNNLLTILMA